MPLLVFGEEIEPENEGAVQAEAVHTINFNDVPVGEFIRFVSKISNVNFIFDNKELQFNVTLTCGRAVSAENVLKALLQMLYVRGFSAVERDGYVVIFRSDEINAVAGDNRENQPLDQIVTLPRQSLLRDKDEKSEFFVYKLQYHQGSEIQEAIKKIAADLQQDKEVSPRLIKAIQSSQWVKSTNSLLCSGDKGSLEQLRKLVASLDVPLRQVFIEILVIETDVRKSMEFGLQWAGGGKYLNKIGFGAGNFPLSAAESPLAAAIQGVNASAPPTGLDQFPIGSGFDFGVIGDIIMHKGKSYFSLGSLISALQIDGDSTIVLNQKIITQDNKNSTIFVGDNIPFTGSVVQTVGQGQQTTANIEYRDIGVNLSITPMLGEGDIITLDLNEEITESVDDINAPSTTTVSGIRTTKTNMVTHVHVPDSHFLVLSGMIRNAKAHHKAGFPCLGGLPYIGAAFSKTRQRDEKRNVIVFVHPRIIHSFEEYEEITEMQEEIYEAQSAPGEFEEAVNLIAK